MQLGALPFDFEEKFLDYFYPDTNDEFNQISKNISKNFSKYKGTYRSYDGIAKLNLWRFIF